MSDKTDIEKSDLSDVTPQNTTGSSGAKHLHPPAQDLFVQVDNLQEGEANTIQRPSVSYWQDAWMRIRKNKLALWSGVLILFLAILSVALPYILPYNHTEQEVWNLHLPPSLGREAIVVGDVLDWYEPVKSEESVSEEVSSEGPPATPVNLKIMGEPLSTAVALQWDAVEGAEGYRIYRSIEDDTLGVPLADVEFNDLSYLDSSALDPGELYFYRVISFNFFEDSKPSEILEVRPKLALLLADAQRIVPDAEVGETIKTKPHYLGTDHLGRDLLARTLAGAQISLFIGFVAPLIYMFIGVIYGAISGFIGGFVDDVMMRVADIVSTIPELLAVIMLQVFLGSGMWTLIIAMVMVAWARSARQIRGEVLKLREMEFVYASQVLGTPFRKIISRHLLPNVSGTILVLFTLAIPQAIFTEAFLSFIGLGIAPPDASWGTITKDGAKVFLTYPHELVIPASMICVTMFAFNMLGDGLRDALDPKLRGAK
ncbi:ABC transporter permease subunit [Oligoflexaceae bacterium]|nr:ABC transporter permease subunit [Oligoflexaceae bacterium]